MELQKTFCCFCCASGPLSATVALPATGFVPGQGVPIQAEIENASNVKVDRLKILLRKVVTFYTNTPRRDIKKEKVVISEMSVGPVGKRDSQSWNQTLNIPALPPSNLVNCGLIDLDYEIKVGITWATLLWQPNSNFFQLELLAGRIECVWHAQGPGRTHPNYIGHHSVGVIASGCDAITQQWRWYFQCAYTTGIAIQSSGLWHNANVARMECSAVSDYSWVFLFKITLH